MVFATEHLALILSPYSLATERKKRFKVFELVYFTYGLYVSKQLYCYFVCVRKEGVMKRIL